MEPKKVPFEEALNKTGFGRYNIVALIFSGTLILGMNAETSSLAYVVPASVCELHTTAEQQGIMAGLPVAGILTLSNVWGYYADTHGRRKVIIISMIMGFVAGGAASFSPNWIVFTVLKFLSFAAVSGTFGVGTSWLSECTPAANRSKFIVMMITLFPATTGIMAVLTIPILPLKFSYYIPYLDIHFNSWRLLNLIYSLGCAITAAAGYFCYESPKFLLSAGREEETLDILRKIYTINSGKDENSYKVSLVMLEEENRVTSGVGIWQSVINQTAPLFKPPLLKHTLLLAIIFISVYFCVQPFVTWVPFIMDGLMKSLDKGETGLTICQMLKSSENITSTEDLKPDDCTLDPTAMLLVFGMNMILSVMNVFASLILPCITKKTMFIGIQLIAGLAALVLSSSTIWVLTAILLVIFVHGLLNFGVLNAFSVNIFPTYVKAMGVCLSLTIGRGSAVVGIYLLKTLLTDNCDATFYVFGSISVAGGLLAFLLPSDKKKAEKDVEESTRKPI